MLKIDFNPPQSQLRQFGWISLIGFPLVGMMLTQWVGSAPILVLWIAIGLGVAMGLCAAANLTAVIKPVYVGMMVIALPIGFVVSYLLLGLVYYGLFTPVALFFKLTGRDTLHRKPDPTAESYWVHRDTPRSPASYLRLY